MFVACARNLPFFFEAIANCDTSHECARALRKAKICGI
jgi:hypothetical protein